MRLGTGLATAKLGGTAVASIRRGANTVYDADATTYLKAVEAADGQGLEPAVAKAIQDFVVGLKATSAGIAADPTRTLWDAVQASCIMCGARTISGALVPLKGTAPTPNNFVSNDYDRATGLVGVPASGTYIDANYSTADLDSPSDHHIAIFPTLANSEITVTYAVIGAGGDSYLRDNVTNQGFRINSNEVNNVAGRHEAGYLFGGSRDETTQYNRLNGVTYSQASTPAAASGAPYSVFGFQTSIGVSARLAFYSFGDGLDLAALDTKVTALVAAVSAALA